MTLGHSVVTGSQGAKGKEGDANTALSSTGTVSKPGTPRCQLWTDQKFVAGNEQQGPRGQREKVQTRKGGGPAELGMPGPTQSISEEDTKMNVAACVHRGECTYPDSHLYSVS